MNAIARFATASAAALLVVAACAAPRAEPAGAGPRLDPRFQSEIQRVVDAIVARDEHAPEQLDALASFAGARRRELLVQVALYLANSSGTEQSMAGALIIGHLQFTPDEKIDTALANLRDAPAPLKRVLTDLLGTIDRPDGAAADFGVYESRLRAARQSPSPEHDQLILYMYEVSPDAALRAMQHVYSSPGGKRVQELRAILARHSGTTAAWSADDTAAARKVIGALCDDPAWWVRLYAASVLAAHPTIATPELRSTLGNDTSSLVRAALSR